MHHKDNCFLRLLRTKKQQAKTKTTVELNMPCLNVLLCIRDKYLVVFVFFSTTLAPFCSILVYLFFFDEIKTLSVDIRDPTCEIQKLIPFSRYLPLGRGFIEKYKIKLEWAVYLSVFCILVVVVRMHSIFWSSAVLCESTDDSSSFILSKKNNYARARVQHFVVWPTRPDSFQVR